MPRKGHEHDHVVVITTYRHITSVGTMLVIGKACEQMAKPLHVGGFRPSGRGGNLGFRVELHVIATDFTS